ncbi:SDR family oxidoreductase [Pseudonocardia nematodicida]|uniref:SDR family oxidoreductase n=1 Tax=Pseudonocardia nematodicida TaxID=1206997 RepID=A0ABV1KHU3_9PSEU
MTAATDTRPAVAWVPGGSSGIGRAVALELAAAGHPVAVTGRRSGAASEVVDEITEAGGRALAVPADMSRTEDVAAGADRIARELGPIGILVHCAGTNVPQRWWSDLAVDDFRGVIDVNLNSVTAAVLAVLPGMRAAGAGRIVIVSSWAGWRFMTGAGAAYGASKAALSPLVESLNDQEGRNGICTTHLCPGEVRTPILMTKPVPPSQEEMDRMLDPADVARATRWVVEQPRGVCVDELVISPAWNRIYIDRSAVPVVPQDR